MLDSILMIIINKLEMTLGMFESIYKLENCLHPSHSEDISTIRRALLDELPQSLAGLSHQCWMVKRLAVIRSEPHQLVDLFGSITAPSYDDVVNIWKAAESSTNDHMFLSEIYGLIKQLVTIDVSIINMLLFRISVDKCMVFEKVFKQVSVMDVDYIVRKSDNEEAFNILRIAKRQNFISSARLKQISWEFVSRCNEAVCCIFDMIDCHSDTDIENAWIYVKSGHIMNLVIVMEKLKVNFKKYAWRNITVDTVAEFMRSLSSHTKLDKRKAAALLDGRERAALYPFLKSRNVGDRIRVWRRVRGRDVVFFVNILSCLKERVGEDELRYAYTRCNIYDIVYIASKLGFSKKIHKYLIQNSDFITFANSRVTLNNEHELVSYSRRLAIIIACEDSRLVDSMYKAIKLGVASFEAFSGDELEEILINCSVEFFPHIFIKEKLDTVIATNMLAKNISRRIHSGVLVKTNSAVKFCCNDLCSICICKFRHFIATLNCGHDFDVHCIVRWFSESSTCPFCRTTCVNITISSLN